ncbi:uncharacterized protein M6B38_348075 [Iris pallida]|uniref:Tyrosine-specific transport protein n=1 Tax=Iris pallida TaxID=29817 RepID=A0AAX6GT41_IRIPA|nr:uncharacterized protein M6B38_348075 [Iris pallida]
MLHLHHNPKPRFPYPSLHERTQKAPTILKSVPISLSVPYPSLHAPIRRRPITKRLQSAPNSQPIDSSTNPNRNFWGAVSLIVGTAVGPGMLGLPSATIRAGPLPSTLAILLSWIYVVSSILLIAELSFAAMSENNADEVSFTSLAADAFGPRSGALVAVVYACLSFALLVACVSGIGSLAVQQFPSANPVLAHALVPGFVGVVIAFFPFEAVDATNRILCSFMLFSIAALVTIGLSLGRSSLLGSLSSASWSFRSIMPAVPVTVLTLGFHVITPFVCRIAGDSPNDARRAILFGGAVPLAMVLSWNAVVLGLAGSGRAGFKDPIELLLSVNSSALPAVQGFAFAALATSLIGYAVSFPKQLVDTVKLIGETLDDGKKMEEDSSSKEGDKSSRNGVLVITWLVLVIPIFVASFFQAAFSRALDFAGVYANCFLFGVLPPVMAWIHRSKRGRRPTSSSEDLLPGGSMFLAILFAIAVVLGIWH